MSYLLYTPDIETPDDDEAKVFEEIADTFTKMGRQVAENEGKAKRVSHAKSTGLLKGTLEVAAGLPPELAQGLFAQPGR